MIVMWASHGAPLTSMFWKSEALSSYLTTSVLSATMRFSHTAQDMLPPQGHGEMVRNWGEVGMQAV